MGNVSLSNGVKANKTETDVRSRVLAVGSGNWLRSDYGLNEFIPLSLCCRQKGEKFCFIKISDLMTFKCLHNINIKLFVERNETKPFYLETVWTYCREE